MSNKPQRIFVRVSDSEKEMIRTKAKQANMSLSEYVVALAKERKIFNLPELPNLIFQISKIGVNINQIATVANSKKSVSTSEIEKTQEYQKEIISLVSKILRAVRGTDELPPISDNEKFEKILAELKRLNKQVQKKED